MPIHNADIAAIFEEIADLLEIEDANPFRIRAYRNAARILSELGRDVRVMVEQGEDLTRLPGIGADLSGKIHEIVETGKCALLERLHQELPAAITELLKIPGIGPRRVRALYHDLDVQTIEQLYKAARDGRIQGLAGFGEKTEQHILQAVETHVQSATGRMKLAVAAQYAGSLVTYLRQTPGVKQVVVAGSFRRCRETVGDLDILVTVDAADAVDAVDVADDGKRVMQRFTAYDEVREVLSAGGTRGSVVLKCGLQVDLRVVAEECYGAALHYFTGGKSHNIALRRLAQERGLKINEYGVFRGEKRIAGETEESVYRSVGLPYIEPELRENAGEIEAARAGLLPRLVDLSDLKGDLHAHTKASDGHNTLREMALAAQQHGFEYLAISEHSQRLKVAHGLDPVQLARHIDAIDRLNQELTGITLLKSVEVDILENGELDLPESILARLDLVIGAVHSKFNLSRAKQTARILQAMDHPHFTLLAHPTGRMIQSRDPYDVDMLRIIRKARERGCFLELNAQPDRLDLLDSHCRMAKNEGVLISINSDSHSVLDLDNLRYGVGQGRRGWLEAKDVLNTRTLKQILPLLRRTM